MSTVSAISPDALAEVLAAVRATRPLVHQLAGPVTLADTANAILAFGGSPVMGVAPEEAAELAAQANALVLNLSMPERDRLEAMLLAGDAARAAGVPVVLDPVGVGATAFRSAAASDLLNRLAITVIRGNAGEIAHLAYGRRSVRGVDAASQAMAPEGSSDVAGDGAADEGDAVAAFPEHQPPSAAAATLVARRHGSVVAATGPLDVVATASALAIVAHGTPLLARIAGSGCIASALVGCCLGTGADPLSAALTALVSLGRAGERASEQVAGPGGFRAALIDALAALTPHDLAREARLRWLTAEAGWE